MCSCLLDPILISHCVIALLLTQVPHMYYYRPPQAPPCLSASWSRDGRLPIPTLHGRVLHISWLSEDVFLSWPSYPSHIPLPRNTLEMYTCPYLYKVFVLTGHTKGSPDARGAPYLSGTNDWDIENQRSDLATFLAQPEWQQPSVYTLESFCQSKNHLSSQVETSVAWKPGLLEGAGSTGRALDLSQGALPVQGACGA
jgi:hypothetical protein